MLHNAFLLFATLWYSCESGDFDLMFPLTAAGVMACTCWAPNKPWWDHAEVLFFLPAGPPGAVHFYALGLLASFRHDPVDSVFFKLFYCYQIATGAFPGALVALLGLLRH